jgi:plasmid stabilization system protein ParE
VSLIVRPAAASDLDDVYLWYEVQRPGLGREFLDAVAQTLQAVVEMPGRFRVVDRDMRRAHVRRFPYSVFFRTVARDVVVVGCFHGRRDPRQWKARRQS